MYIVISFINVSCRVCGIFKNYSHRALFSCDNAAYGNNYSFLFGWICNWMCRLATAKTIKSTSICRMIASVSIGPGGRRCLFSVAVLRVYLYASISMRIRIRIRIRVVVVTVRIDSRRVVICVVGRRTGRWNFVVRFAYQRFMATFGEVTATGALVSGHTYGLRRSAAFGYGRRYQRSGATDNEFVFNSANYRHFDVPAQSAVDSDDGYRFSFAIAAQYSLAFG